jgi:membrane protease YdiL (CAAX protease family)
MKKNILPFLLFVLFGLTFFINGPLPVLGFFLHYDTAVLSQSTYFVTIFCYICIIATLLLEKDNLTTFNFDRSSLIILITVGFIRSNLHVPNEALYKILIVVLSLSLFAIGITMWTKVPKTNINWVFWGILSCALIIPLAFIESAQVAKYVDSNRVYEGNFIGTAIKNFLFNLSFVAPFEEITVRGILWGLLRKWNFDEKKIFWLQGIYFWLSHFNQIFTPITFFITLPIFILTFSLLTKYSKQIFPSITAHTLMNTLIPIFVMIYSK